MANVFRRSLNLAIKGRFTNLNPDFIELQKAKFAAFKKALSELLRRKI